MADFIELRPNKELLNAKFEGYTLSLDPLPVYKHHLPVGVQHLRPSDEQFSFQHVKTFGYHNHLYSDPWNSEFVFYMSKDLQVFRASIRSLTGQNPKIEAVGTISRSRDNQEGFFNSSLSFSSPTLAVASDGGGFLSILDTHDRTSSNPVLWQVLLSENIFIKETPFKVLHSYLDKTGQDGTSNLYVLLLRVEAFGDVDTQISLSKLGCNARENPFITTIEYVTFSNSTGHWAFKQLKRLAVPHGIDYASILSPGKSLCLIAREPAAIIYDSFQSIEAPQSDITDVPIYQWCEDPEEVTLWFSFDKNASKQDIGVELTTTSIKVTYKDEVKVQGNLFEKISVDSSLWTLSDGKLEIILTKSVKALNWDYLIQHDAAGNKVSDAQTAHEWHQRLINMSAEEMAPETVGQRPPLFTYEELEECDSTVMDEMILFRFNGETNQFSHKSALGNHQLLFTTPSAPNTAPAFCLRHDVDGLVWEPMGDEELARNGNKWDCRHTAALHAFGYIQASKEHRKFTLCPPSNMYVAVCDAFRHVYIYRQPGCPSTGVQMVHRPSGRKVANVARSQVLSIDDTEECLGALATDAFVIILTASSLIAIRVNDD